MPKQKFQVGDRVVASWRGGMEAFGGKHGKVVFIAYQAAGMMQLMYAVEFDVTPPWNSPVLFQAWLLDAEEEVPGLSEMHRRYIASIPSKELALTIDNFTRELHRRADLGEAH